MTDDEQQTMNEGKGQETGESMSKSMSKGMNMKYFIVVGVAILLIFSAMGGFLLGIQQKADFDVKNTQEQCNEFICENYLHGECSKGLYPGFKDPEMIYEERKLNQTMN